MGYKEIKNNLIHIKHCIMMDDLRYNLSSLLDNVNRSLSEVINDSTNL